MSTQLTPTMRNADIGRVFLGISLISIGLLQLFFPGIRPILFPDATGISSQQHPVLFLIPAVLMFSGLLIVTGRRIVFISLFFAIAFFLLFLFGHLPAFLAVSGIEKLKYWVNLNKALALSGGFLILAATYIPPAFSQQHPVVVRIMMITGRIFFGCMLFLFGLGHFLSLASVSALVPDYIPFKAFWTIVGGIVLMLSALSIFSKFKMQTMSLILAAVLFVWLITLHLYHSFRSPDWQQGENFVGALTCLAFCGTALLLAEKKSDAKALHRQVPKTFVLLGRNFTKKAR